MLPLALLSVGGALLYSSTHGPSNVTNIKSSVNGKEYQVQNLPDKEEAVERMSKIRQNLVKICDHFKDPNFKQDEPYQRLITRFNPDALEENDISRSKSVKSSI